MHAAPERASRRNFLARAALAAAGLATLAMPAPRRLAAAAPDYKALVAVYLYGGNDGLNTLVPLEDAQHRRYRDARGALALPASSLISLPGAPYGLHPALAPLQTAWSGRRLAAVQNVGPMVAPAAKPALLQSPSTLLPPGLLAHLDQQALWESATMDPRSAHGWGGRAAERLHTAQPVISAAGTARFGAGQRQPGMSVSGPGSEFAALTLRERDTGFEPWRLRREALLALYRETPADALNEAYVAQQLSAFAVTERLAEVVRLRPGDSPALTAIDTAFAPLLAGAGPLDIASQLYQVAKLVAVQAPQPGQRQFFFTGMPGFDLHGQQVDAADPTRGEHAVLLARLGRALAAFDESMQRLGLGERVTLFTASEFGRTLTANLSGGTDHGWGGLQLVLGGAVAGGRVLGDLPPLLAGSDDDIDLALDPRLPPAGRFIPGWSVEQYAAELLRWFGADDADLQALLPSLAAFAGRSGPPLFAA
jgi:uncharacterized protein (DUF1501 family)